MFLGFCDIFLESWEVITDRKLLIINEKQLTEWKLLAE